VRTSIALLASMSVVGVRCASRPRSDTLQPHGETTLSLTAEKGRRRYEQYSRSKLANMMMVYAMARRLEAANAPVTANVLEPGVVGAFISRDNRFTTLVFFCQQRGLYRPVPLQACTSAGFGKAVTL
jgi:NAD(P)-dependent dehydrogenase (short-subunit alcohol dehydrogenase family)